jgi:phosphate transport system substrate-binding protein
VFASEENGMLGRISIVALTMLALTGCNRESEPIRASGSSTVYPFTKAVADAFVRGGEGRQQPAVESTGTESGIERFCDGAKDGGPDIADASRRMKRSEFAKCQANGAKDIIEVPIGLDGIALAESNQGPKLTLSRKDIYLALAANPMGKPNTAKTWRDVNPALPAVAIQVLGPPSTSGTRDMFVSLILEEGCLAAMPEAKTMRVTGDPAVFERTCRQIRSDGAYVQEGEDDRQIVQALAKTPNAVGLLGYSYLEQNTGQLRAVPIDGVAPDTAAISSGRYPGARTLYLYVKKQRLEKKPELRAFLDLYATMWGPNGPLAKQGLIAMSEKARNRSAEAIKLAEPLDAESLI